MLIKLFLMFYNYVCKFAFSFYSFCCLNVSFPETLLLAKDNALVDSRQQYL